MMHIDILVEVCGELWNEGGRGMPLGMYLHSDLSCSRGDSVSTLQTSSSCAKGWTGHTICVVHSSSILLSAAPRSRTLLCSHLKALREQSGYAPTSQGLGPRVSRRKVRKQYFDAIQIFFHEQSGIMTMNDKMKIGAKSLTLPFCLFHDNHIILKPKETLKNITTFKITKYTALGNRDTYNGTYIHLSALKWIKQIKNREKV